MVILRLSSRPLDHLKPLASARRLHHLVRHPRPLALLPPLPLGSTIYSSDRVSLHKSVFVGHAVRVRSIPEVRCCRVDERNAGVVGTDSGWEEQATIALEHILAIKRVGKST